MQGDSQPNEHRAKARADTNILHQKDPEFGLKIISWNATQTWDTWYINGLLKTSHIFFYKIHILHCSAKIKTILVKGLVKFDLTTNYTK